MAIHTSAHTPTAPAGDPGIGRAAPQQTASKPNASGAVIGTAKAFSAPLALAALLPPPYRSLSLAPSALIWTISQDAQFRPPAHGGALSDDLLKYAPFIPALAAQTAMHGPQTWTGQRLAQVDKAWRALCEKASSGTALSATERGAALKSAVTNYPLAFVGTRVAAQLAAAYCGTVAAGKYGAGARAALQEQPGAGDKGGQSEATAQDDWLRFAPAALFMLPILAFSAPGRATIARGLRLPPDGKFNPVLTDLVATTTLVGAASGANAVRRSDWFQQLEDKGHARPA